ncbi:amino acid transporter, putative, partial [Perkinsus marinus ATCC 50983]
MSEKSSISTRISDFSADSVTTGGRPDGSSNFRTVINFALVAVGVGILALPRAIAQGGWILGSVLLAVAWSVAQYGTYLLYRCMYMHPKGEERFDSFQAIGKACFGKPGEIFTAFVQYLDLLLVCSLLVILVGDGMYELVPQLDRIWWCVIFVCVMLPLAMLPTMKEVAFVSFIGITAAFVTVIAVIGASVRESSDPIKEHEHYLMPQNASTAVLAFTNFMNAFAVTTV